MQARSLSEKRFDRYFPLKFVKDDISRVNILGTDEEFSKQICYTSGGQGGCLVVAEDLRFTVHETYV